MRPLRVLCIAILFAVLSGCATPYQSTGYRGGYSETALGERKYIVEFDGNGYTSGDRVRRYWLLQCAQLTLENGYSHFVIVSADRGATTSSMQLGQDRVVVQPDGYGGATATTYEAADIPVTKHSAEGLVYFFHEHELTSKIEAQAVDAQWFWKNNRER